MKVRFVDEPLTLFTRARPSFFETRAAGIVEGRGPLVTPAGGNDALVPDDERREPERRRNQPHRRQHIRTERQPPDERGQDGNSQPGG